MSVTFAAPGAPRHRVPCSTCALVEGDEWAEQNEHGGWCSPTCDGTELVSDAPSVNMTNFAAADILNLLGLYDGELIGEVQHDDLPDLLQRLVRALNGDLSNLRRDPIELEPGHAGVVVVEDADGVSRIERRGCRAYVGGTTDEQVVRRLRGLMMLVSWARERGLGVSWS